MGSKQTWLSFAIIGFKFYSCRFYRITRKLKKIKMLPPLGSEPKHLWHVWRSSPACYPSPNSLFAGSQPFRSFRCSHALLILGILLHETKLMVTTGISLRLVQSTTNVLTIVWRREFSETTPCRSTCNAQAWLLYLFFYYIIDLQASFLKSWFRYGRVDVWSHLSTWPNVVHVFFYLEVNGEKPCF